jgi:hypothetical protein
MKAMAQDRRSKTVQKRTRGRSYAPSQARARDEKRLGSSSSAPISCPAVTQRGRRIRRLSRDCSGQLREVAGRASCTKEVRSEHRPPAPARSAPAWTLPHRPRARNRTGDRAVPHLRREDRARNTQHDAEHSTEPRMRSRRPLVESGPGSDGGPPRSDGFCGGRRVASGHVEGERFRMEGLDDVRQAGSAEDPTRASACL